MKSRASLVLMEQLVMVLVFALAASLCLQVFVRADRISRETALQDQAVVLAQNGAETVKACKGDLTAAAQMLGGVAADGVLAVSCGDLRLEMEITPAEIPGLGLCDVRVVGIETETLLFSLTAAWQEVR